MEWHKGAGLQVAAQRRDRTLMRASMRIHLYFGTKGVADLTNKAESICDLLVDCAVLADDNWKVMRRLELTGSYRKGAPGALIRIIPRGKL